MGNESPFPPPRLPDGPYLPPVQPPPPRLQPPTPVVEPSPGFAPPVPAPAPTAPSPTPPTSSPRPPSVGRWLAAAALAALAVIGLGVWAFSRGAGTAGRDQPVGGTPAPGETASGDTSPAQPATDPSVGPDDTFVITAPEATSSGRTLPDSGTDPTAAPGERLVTDDTGFFTVAVPNDFEVSTEAIDANGLIVPSVMAATDLNRFGNDFVTVGYVVNAVSSELAVTEHDAIALVGPSEQDCANIDPETSLDTEVGPAVLQTAEGCGAEAGSVAVVALIDDTSGRVFVVYAQGANTSDAVRSLARAVLESVTIN